MHIPIHLPIIQSSEQALEQLSKSYREWWLTLPVNMRLHCILPRLLTGTGGGIFAFDCQRWSVSAEAAHSTTSLVGLEMLLQAYQLNADASFLHVADRCGEAWADALLDGDAVPDGLPQSTAAKPARTAPQSDEIIRARDWIEHGAINIFLSLYRHTASPIYLIATRKLLDIAASDLRSQDCAYAVNAMRIYYKDFADGYFDEYVRIAGARNPLQGDQPLHLAFENDRTPTVATHDGQLVAHPVLQLFYGQLTDRPEHTRLAMQLALAVQEAVLPLATANPERWIPWLKGSITGGNGWLEDIFQSADNSN